MAKQYTPIDWVADVVSGNVENYESYIDILPENKDGDQARVYENSDSATTREWVLDFTQDESQKVETVTITQPKASVQTFTIQYYERVESTWSSTRHTSGKTVILTDMLTGTQIGSGTTDENGRVVIKTINKKNACFARLVDDGIYSDFYGLYSALNNAYVTGHTSNGIISQKQHDVLPQLTYKVYDFSNQVNNGNNKLSNRFYAVTWTVDDENTGINSGSTLYYPEFGEDTETKEYKAHWGQLIVPSNISSGCSEYWGYKDSTTKKWVSNNEVPIWFGAEEQQFSGVTIMDTDSKIARNGEVTEFVMSKGTVFNRPIRIAITIDQSGFGLYQESGVTDYPKLIIVQDGETVPEGYEKVLNDAIATSTDSGNSWVVCQEKTINDTTKYVIDVKDNCGKTASYINGKYTSQYLSKMEYAPRACKISYCATSILNPEYVAWGGFYLIQRRCEDQIIKQYDYTVKTNVLNMTAVLYKWNDDNNSYSPVTDDSGNIISGKCDTDFGSSYYVSCTLTYYDKIPKGGEETYHRPSFFIKLVTDGLTQVTYVNGNKTVKLGKSYSWVYDQDEEDGFKSLENTAVVYKASYKLSEVNYYWTTLSHIFGDGSKITVEAANNANYEENDNTTFINLFSGATDAIPYSATVGDSSAEIISVTNKKVRFIDENGEVVTSATTLSADGQTVNLTPQVQTITTKTYPDGTQETTYSTWETNTSYTVSGNSLDENTSSEEKTSTISYKFDDSDLGSVDVSIKQESNATNTSFSVFSRIYNDYSVDGDNCYIDVNKLSIDVYCYSADADGNVDTSKEYLVGSGITMTPAYEELPGSGTSISTKGYIDLTLDAPKYGNISSIKLNGVADTVMVYTIGESNELIAKTDLTPSVQIYIEDATDSSLKSGDFGYNQIKGKYYAPTSDFTITDIASKKRIMMIIRYKENS